MRSGLVIANADGNLRQHQIYDTRKKKLTVDVNIEPPHLNIIESLSGGTKFSVAAADTSLKEETLLTIPHQLGFKPMFLVYFYPTKTPDLFSGSLRQYSINMAFMLYNAIALGDEWLEADADNINLYIKHKAIRFGFGGPDPYVFYGSDYTYRIRYMIFNVPSYLLD